MAITDTDASAIFIGVTLEALFYGIYTVLFGVFVSQQRRHSKPFNRPVPISLIILFVLCTACFAMDVPQVYYYVVDGEKIDPFIPLALWMASSAAFFVVDFLCQCIMIYRCWIVWGQRWIIVAVPIVMALAALGAEFALIAMVSLTGVDGAPSFPQLYPTGIGAFSVSLVVNTLVSALIVTQIWLSSREIRQTMPGVGKTYRVAISMLVESGLFIFFIQLIWVLTYALSEVAYDLVISSINMIYGITPTVLAIRVNVGTPYETDASWRGSSLRMTTGDSAISLERMRRGDALSSTTLEFESTKEALV